MFVHSRLETSPLMWILWAEINLQKPWIYKTQVDEQQLQRYQCLGSWKCLAASRIVTCTVVHVSLYYIHALIMYVYIYICACACFYSKKYIHNIHLMNVNVDICLYIQKYIHIYICICICIHLRAFICSLWSWKMLKVREMIMRGFVLIFLRLLLRMD